MAIVIVAPTQYGIEIAKKTYISPVDPLIWLVGALWLVDILNGRRCATIQWPPLYSLLFILVAVVSSLKASPSLASFKDVFQWVEYFVAATMLFASNVDNPRLTRTITYTFLGVATAVVALGFIQYLTPSTEAFRIRGAFGNRNVLGGYISLVLPLCFGLLLFDSNGLRRIWYGLLLAIGSIITLSGGTLIAVSLSMGTLAMVKSPRAFAVLAVVCLAAGAFVFPHLPRNNGGILYESIRLYDDNNDVSRRYTEWEAAATMIAENPWTGVGAGRYQDNIGSFYGTLPHSPATTSEHDSQNLYLVIASSMGLLGLFTFLGMLFFAGAQATRRFLEATDNWHRGLFLGLFGGLLAFCINSLWSPLLVRGIGVPLVILMALASARWPAERAGPRSDQPSLRQPIRLTAP